MLPEGRAIVRGGFGRFAQRTPLNVGAFESFEPRTISRFNVDGSSIGQPITLTNRLDGPLRTPEAEVGNIEWDQRFGRRVLLKVAFLGRTARTSILCRPIPGLAPCVLPASARRVQGTRKHGAVSGRRAPRPDDVVCVGAR